MEPLRLLIGWVHGLLQQRTLWCLVSPGFTLHGGRGHFGGPPAAPCSGSCFYYLHLTDERTEVQKDEVIHPESLQKLV